LKATISAEWIGKDTDEKLRMLGEGPMRKPWCARVELKWKGFYRHFIDGKVDYTHANSKGSRGVFVWFIIESGYVYEMKRSLTWRSSERVFLRVRSDGTIEEGAIEDAERWLSYPLE
jgi:hypothetical protein